MTRSIILIGSLFIAASSVIHPEPARAETAVEALLDRAAFLMRSGRHGQARDVYERALRAVPNHPDALVGLGTMAARAGRDAEARGYLSRLRRAHPHAEGLERLSHAVRLGTRYRPLLDRARARARAGQPEEAIIIYRQAFGRAGPTEEVAFEYYTTLGGTRDGWHEARRGLERLAKRRPNAEHRLALARHLTYREETRRSGIAKLLPAARSGDAAATAAVVDALVWLEAKEEDLTMYREVTKLSDDPRLPAKLRALAPSARDQRARQVARGYAKLDAEDTAAAKEIFEAAGVAQRLESRAGLAAIAMREERFDEALQIYSDLETRAATRPELWKDGLAAARFWEAMSAGRASLEVEEWATAEAHFTRAETHAYADHLHQALASRGFALRGAGDQEGAARYFRAAIEAHPDSEPAYRGLRDLAVERSAWTEAVAFNARLLELEAPSARQPGALEAERDRQLASSAKAKGATDRTQLLLERAAASDPKNPWILYDLASLSHELGDTEHARAYLERLGALDGGLVEAQILRARIESESGHPRRAREVLAAIPRERMTPELARFIARTEIEVEVSEATHKWFSGDRAAARHELLRLHADNALEPDHLALVAQGWASVGDTERAIGALHETLSQQNAPSVGVQLQLAGVLLQANETRELEELLRHLAARPISEPRARRDLLALQVAHAVRRADLDREKGRYASAFDRIAPLLTDHPDDATLLASLGRIFRSSGRLDEARVVFSKILSNEPYDIDARAGAIETSLAIGNQEQARLLLDQGIQLLPEHPRMYLVKGRTHAQLGEDAEAMGALSEARRLAERRAMGQLSGPEPRDGPSLSSGAEAPQVLLAGYRAFGFEAEAAPAASETQVILEGIAEEERKIQEKYAITLEGAFNLRQRQGLEGLGYLTELGGHAVASIPLGYATRVWIEARPLSLDSGPRNLSVADAARFGSLGAAAGTTASEPSTSMAGSSIAAGLRWGDLSIDVGTTPLGFEIETFTGGLRYGTRAGNFGFALEASRRSVEDSLLSFGGLRDPGTGALWGGVVRQGGRLDLSLDVDDGIYYAYGGGYHLEGTRVRENLQWIGGAGGEWKVLDTPGSKVTLGLGGLAMGYAEDLSQFSLGHGGYFSPQLFLRAGVPFAWRANEGDFRWRLSADPGLNWFRTDPQAWFPEDASLQAARVAVAGSSEASVYEGRTVLSFSLNAGGALEYAVMPGLVAGGRLDLHFAEDYEEITGGVFLRYAFNGRERTELPVPTAGEMFAQSGGR